MTDAPVAVDETTRRAQLTASDPDRSAWVSANAGSGKTYVLAQRVIRLLLSGVDPGRILCLTFTKAAAAEMSKRVFGTLAEWTQLGDAELAEKIVEVDGSPPSADTLARARRLFARALETPGGLKIQTIHAFCERLLHQFPFEANVAGQFEVLDEQQSAGLIAEARQSVLARAVQDSGHVLGTAFKIIIGGVSDYGYEQAVTEFVDHRDDIQAWTAKAGSLRKALDELRDALGLEADDKVEALTEEILDGALLSEDDLRGIAAALAAGGQRDKEAGAKLAFAINAGNIEIRRRAYLNYFLKADGAISALSTVVSKVVKNAGYEDALSAEHERIRVLLDRIATADAYEASEAMLRLTDAVIQDYEARKARGGFLDFRDLVVKTGNLLLRRDAAQWVHYKLDQGLDHILVDEAQDTSPRQWDVVVKLAEEFFSGTGASDRVRTIFAVGDEKQSIYSFQGAVPARFSRVREYFLDRAGGAGATFSKVELHASFRSSPDVLSGVDAVFTAAEAHAGLSSDAGPTTHSAARLNAPGHVVFWPMAEPLEKPVPGAWDEPLDHLGSDSPEAQLAGRIATTIKTWLRSNATLDNGKPIQAGDILILTRSRSALSDAINRALKEEDVPIAGADRLQMGEHIAVLDLLVLGDIILLPEDDLPLAALLRSPLFGISEDDLFQLAHGRRGNTLWQALSVAQEPQFTAAFKQLGDWRKEADFRAPHDFYARVLGADGGRRRFMARLGAETEDVLDEFLAQALAYERSETPSLQGFLHWSRTTATEVKREPALFRDEVRVMTVHGAKGLEADVVFFVDDGSALTHGGHDPRVVALTDDPDAALPAPIVWHRGKKYLSPIIDRYIQSLRARRRDEYRRLLYVGLTRARDRLIVCGTAKRAVTDRAMGWHALVRRGLEPQWREMADDTGEAFEWRSNWSVPRLSAVEPEAVDAVEFVLPDWLGKPAAEAPAAMRRLSPSRALAEAEDAARQFSERNTLEARLDPQTVPALERGLIVHRLLQSLPELRAEARRDAAARYLDWVAAHWSPEERAATVAEVLAVMDDPGFAAVFGPGSRAEIELAGRLPTKEDQATIAGRVDRIVVTPERVLIVDYKSNRPAPASLEEVPRDYVAQLAVYRRALAGLYPNRPVAAALLWTDGPRIMEIPDPALDHAETLLFGRKPSP